MKPASRSNGHSRARASLPSDAYDCEPRVALVLSDETAYVTRYDRGLPANTIPVKLDQAAAALGRFGADTGLLPEGILFWQTKANRERLAVWVPPARRRLTFSLERFAAITIPLPGLVFVGSGADYSVWAAHRRPANAREPLYHAPLPNIFGDGKICAGTVKFPKCGPATIWDAVTLFFESGFNHDLEGDHIGGAAKPMDFLRSLQKARTFPLERLVPAGAMGDVLARRAPAARPMGPDDLGGPDEDDDQDDDFIGDGEEGRAELVAQQAEMME